MAPRLKSPPLPADHPKRKAYADGGRDTPCQYCGGVPTRVIEVVPAEYKDNRLVHRPHFADLCLDCLRGLGIMVPDRSMTVHMVKSRKGHAADKRRDVRKEAKASQLSIFGDEDAPGNAVTEG